MNEQNGSNGNGAAETERPNGVQRMVLTFDPHTFKLHIDLDAMNMDCAKSMLDQAGRWVDGQLRMQQLAAVQQQIAEAQRTKALVDSVSGNLRA